MIDSDFKEIEKFHSTLEQLEKDMPSIMNRLAVSEGTRFVRKAMILTKESGKVSTSHYKKSWHSDSKATVIGKSYKVGVGNTANYSLFLEKGFRSHFVPGYWVSKRFVYQENAKEIGFKGGMYVGEKGGTVKGLWIAKRTKEYIENTQQNGLKRKFLKELRERFDDFK